MEQKKTALSAQLRNMDTWLEQWEEGCPGGLNNTPHLSLEVRAFRHPPPSVFVETLPQNPAQKEESKFLDCFINYSEFEKLKYKNGDFVKHTAKTDICSEESFGQEPSPLISQKFAIKSHSNHRQMCCPPLLSSICHPLHRLTGILQRG